MKLGWVMRQSSQQTSQAASMQIRLFEHVVAVHRFDRDAQHVASARQRERHINTGCAALPFYPNVRKNTVIVLASLVWR